MNVLITGGAGFIGTVLTPMLINRDISVRVVDCGLFGTEFVDDRAELVDGDVLQFDPAWLDGVDAVIHLSGLSNDPMAEFTPELNYMLNAASTAIVAHHAKARGIGRFIFASTCSVYGFNDAADVDEDHDVNPSFPYAVSKVMAERALRCLTDERFRPIILRKGTVVGWSPKMRFDLVTNAMVRSALLEKRISVHNPSLWRPLLDVTDAARAYIRALDADPSLTGTFNIAEDNYTIGRLADEVRSTLQEFDVDVPLDIHHRVDLRSYRVSTRRAADVLDFRASLNMRDTVRRIMRKLTQGEVPDLTDPKYDSIAQLKEKARTGVLPSFWGQVVAQSPPVSPGSGAGQE